MEDTKRSRKFKTNHKSLRQKDHFSVTLKSRSRRLMKYLLKRNKYRRVNERFLEIYKLCYMSSVTTIRKRAKTQLFEAFVLKATGKGVHGEDKLFHFNKFCFFSQKYSQLIWLQKWWKVKLFFANPCLAIEEWITQQPMRHFVHVCFPLKYR